MLALFINIIFSFIFITFLGHLIHVVLHQPWSSFFNKAHLNHHKKQYPPEDHFSEKYRSAGKDNTVYLFLIIASPIILLALGLYIFGLISFYSLIVFYGMMGLLGFVHDYTHKAFHIKNHWLYRVPFVNKYFSNLVDTHIIHHQDMSKNFGIITFVWDKIFKSFKEK